MIERKQIGNGRVFELGELEGFYIGNGRCVHITFEDADTIVIDVLDTEQAAFDGDAGDTIGQPIVINVQTGEARFEAD